MIITLAQWTIETFPDALLFSLLCIVAVFLILIIIATIMSLLNRVRALDVKEVVKMKDGTEADEDMMAAIFVATLEYRKERKEDCKVLSCKLLEDENKKSNK